MNSDQAPSPTVMPIDRERWATRLDLSNFVNAYYQFRDVHRLDSCKTVLIIGPGQGLGTEVLAWRGYEVTTFDIDETLKPNVVGSVHDLGAFKDKQFDAVIASHVLEHFPEPYLDSALYEIARVGRYALIYLPVHGLHLQFRFATNFRSIDRSLIFDVFNYFRKCDGMTPRYMSGQHFWEIGLKGFRVKDLVKRMSAYFEIISVYRNRDWTPSQNFILRSKVGR